MATINQLVTFSTPRVESAVAYVWHFDLDNDTVVSGQPEIGAAVTVQKRLNRSGTLRWSCVAVDAIGQKSDLVDGVSTGILNILPLPTIELVSVSQNDLLLPSENPVTISVAASAPPTWSDGLGWTNSGAAAATVNYQVLVPVTLTATVTTPGGTAQLSIEIRGRMDKAPFLATSVRTIPFGTASPVVSNTLQAGAGSFELTAIAVDPESQAISFDWAGDGLTLQSPTVTQIGTGSRSVVLASVPASFQAGSRFPSVRVQDAHGETRAVLPVVVLRNSAPTILGFIVSSRLVSNSFWEGGVFTAADEDTAKSPTDTAPYRWFPNCPVFSAVVYDEDNEDQPIAPYAPVVYSLAAGNPVVATRVVGWVEVLVKFQDAGLALPLLPLNAPVVLRLAFATGGIPAGDYRGVVAGRFRQQQVSVAGETVTLSVLPVWIKRTPPLLGETVSTTIALMVSVAARPLKYRWTCSFSFASADYTPWPKLILTGPSVAVPLGARRNKKITGGIGGQGGDFFGAISGSIGDTTSLPIVLNTLLYRQSVPSGFGAPVAYSPSGFPAVSGVSGFSIDATTGNLSNSLAYTPGQAQLNISYVQPRGDSLLLHLAVTDQIGNVVQLEAAAVSINAG